MLTQDEKLDLIIIGAGPAGLSAADTAAREGLSYLVLEKGLIANTVYGYPIGRTVFSTPNELEMREGVLQPCRDKPTREELLSHYVKFALGEDLQIHTNEDVIEVESCGDDCFLVRTAIAEYKAARLLFAIGAMAFPKRLDVPGEGLPKVQHRFVEPYPYVKKEVLVVGGGNSAAEAALFLSEEGARTTIAIWRTDWENLDPKRGAIKHWVRTPLERDIAEGRLTLQLFREILEITEGEVRMITDDGEEKTIKNDAVFILIGADADLRLLKSLGVQSVQAGFNEVPVYDGETFETNIPGVFVAGHFTHARHIKEAIAVPRRIVPMIAEGLRSTATK
jgi:putative YpdA family bacillithiol system oxidoreductase